LAPQAGDHLEVTLPLPEGRVGGVGVRFRPESGGMRVIHLVEDSPAWAAGLEPGDLIVDVNGESTAGMESVDFIQRMTGEEGTGVSFVIGWDADTGWTEEALEVSRQYLSG
jgi:C-terminal processing protease CtpA/Prc